MARLGRLRWGARGAQSRPTARTPMHARPGPARTHDPRIRFPRAERQLNRWPPGARGRCSTATLSPQPCPAGVGRRHAHAGHARPRTFTRPGAPRACCVSAGKPRLRLGPAGVAPWLDGLRGPQPCRLTRHTTTGRGNAPMVFLWSRCHFEGTLIEGAASAGYRAIIIVV